jgi:hypothetical protein
LAVGFSRWLIPKPIWFRILFNDPGLLQRAGIFYLVKWRFAEDYPELNQMPIFLFNFAVQAVDLRSE